MSFCDYIVAQIGLLVNTLLKTFYPICATNYLLYRVTLLQIVLSSFLSRGGSHATVFGTEARHKSAISVSLIVEHTSEGSETDVGLPFGILWINRSELHSPVNNRVFPYRRVDFVFPTTTFPSVSLFREVFLNHVVNHFLVFDNIPVQNGIASHNEIRAALYISTPARLFFPLKGEYPEAVCEILYRFGISPYSCGTCRQYQPRGCS